MSIVIAICDRNITLYLASDKRAKRNGVVWDNYQKIFKLKDDLYYAMTGIAESGLSLLEKINKYTNENSIDSFLSKVDEVFSKQSSMLTVTICGKTEENNFFIWQKNNTGEVTKANINSGTVAFSIATNDNDEKYEAYLTKQLLNHIPVQYAICNTIKYASEMDDSISSVYDIIVIKK